MACRIRFKNKLIFLGGIDRSSQPVVLHLVPEQIIKEAQKYFLSSLLQTDLAPNLIATVHPSSILRAPDDETRHAEIERFLADLKKVVEVIRQER